MTPILDVPLGLLFVFVLFALIPMTISELRDRYTRSRGIRHALYLLFGILIVGGYFARVYFRL